MNKRSRYIKTEKRSVGRPRGSNNEDKITQIKVKTPLWTQLLRLGMVLISIGVLISPKLNLSQTFVLLGLIYIVAGAMINIYR